MTAASLAAPPVTAPFGDDNTLLAAVARRDGAAFVELYARYGGAAYRVAFRLLAEHEIAEDVVQEAFFAIWRRAASFDPARGDVEAWLLTSVRYAALSRLRGKQGRARFDIPLERIAGLSTRDDPHAIAEAGELRERVRHSLADLPAAQREAIELAYFAELTCEEIAARTAVALGTAKGRLRLARAKLRTSLASATAY